MKLDIMSFLGKGCCKAISRNGTINNISETHRNECKKHAIHEEVDSDDPRQSTFINDSPKDIKRDLNINFGKSSQKMTEEETESWLRENLGEKDEDKIESTKCDFAQIECISSEYLKSIVDQNPNGRVISSWKKLPAPCKNILLNSAEFKNPDIKMVALTVPANKIHALETAVAFCTIAAPYSLLFIVDLLALKKRRIVSRTSEDGSALVADSKVYRIV